MLAEYFPILLFILVGLAVGVAPVVLGTLLGPSRPDPDPSPRSSRSRSCSETSGGVVSHSSS